MKSKEKLNVLRDVFSKPISRHSQSMGWIENEERPVLDETFKTPVEVLLKNYEYTKRIIEDADCLPLLIRGMDKLRFIFVVPISKKSAFMRSLTRSKISPSIRVISPRSGLPTQTYNTSNFKKIELNSNINVLRLTWHLGEEGRDGYNGEEYGSEVEFWDDVSPVGQIRLFADEWVAPRHNASGKRIRISEGITTVPLAKMTNFSPAEFEYLSSQTFAISEKLNLDLIDFPIDIVFTWVDSSDPKWQKKKNEHSPENNSHSESASEARYINRDELKYSLRSIWMFAPWIHNIYIVTDEQQPTWLDKNRDNRIKIISHSDIFSDQNYLPTFNSHAIESQIHKIPGLAEHFIYLNDDMLFGRPVIPGQFFYANGTAKHFRSQSRVPSFEKNPLDTPVDQATKNSREVLMQKFGRAQSQVFEHAPYAILKSAMYEIEKEFPQQVKRTAAARFRSPNDINIPSHLVHYWSYLTGRSIPSSIAFSYIGLAVHDVQRRLDRLEHRRNVDAFCINDTFTENIDLEKQSIMVENFMSNYFPHPSPWEL